MDELEGDDLKRHYPSDYYAYSAATLPRFLLWLTMQEDRFATRMGGRVVGRLITAVPHSIRVVVDDSSYLGFLGSEAYRRGIALSDPKMFWKMLRIVGPKGFWIWQKRAELLNRQGRGDWTGFVLRPV